MKICLRYPFPKSFPSGKGLAIAPLKVFHEGCSGLMVFPHSRREKVVQKHDFSFTSPTPSIPTNKDNDFFHARNARVQRKQDHH